MTCQEKPPIFPLACTNFQITEIKKQRAFRPPVLIQMCIFVLAASTTAVAAAGFAFILAAAAQSGATAAMDPNDNDSNDHNDPEGLIPTTEKTIAPAVIATITSVHEVLPP